MRLNGRHTKWWCLTGLLNIVRRLNSTAVTGWTIHLCENCHVGKLKSDFFDNRHTMVVMAYCQVQVLWIRVQAGLTNSSAWVCMGWYPVHQLGDGCNNAGFFQPIKFCLDMGIHGGQALVQCMDDGAYITVQCWRTFLGISQYHGSGQQTPLGQ